MATMWRIILGLLMCVVCWAGGQRRPPNYSQDQMPLTSFSCRDKIIGGYYADPETDCQMFHVCVKVPGQGVQDYKFLCPNDTSFDQENQICDDWFNIDCEASTLYYSDNFDLYRIGSDLPRVSQGFRLPSNNINNAVSETDDDYYVQKSDRGENVGSDLLRGSHSSNFYSNRNRGREDDDDDVKEDYQRKNNNKNVRKLLTGKRPISSTAAPIDTYSTSPQYQQRNHNNNYAGRTSQFRGHARKQQTEAPTRPTETYNRQPLYQQRNYYSPTTPKIETTPSTQNVDYYKNYNPTTKRSYYENTPNVQTTAFPQTTRNYQNARIITTSQPSTTYSDITVSTERNSIYETQKLFKLNTGAFNQYDDSKDEFLKTAPSQNLGASAFNSLQKSLKNFNTSVSSSYNFQTPTKETNSYYQTQTYYNPTTQQTTNFYTQTTVKPFQQQNYYTTPKVQVTQQTYQPNYYNPSTDVSSTPKSLPQYNPTTLRAHQQQTYPQSTVTQFQQYTPTTLKPYYNQQTNLPFQKQNNQQQNYQAPFQNQPTTNYQAPKNTGTAQVQSQTVQPTYQPQRGTAQFQQYTNYYNPTTQRQYSVIQTTAIPKAKVTDITERPRPFTQENKKEEKKEKEQYDYAYYDDGTQAEYDSIEPLEEFKRTKSKN